MPRYSPDVIRSRCNVGLFFVMLMHVTDMSRDTVRTAVMGSSPSTGGRRFTKDSTGFGQAFGKDRLWALFVILLPCGTLVSSE